MRLIAQIGASNGYLCLDAYSLVSHGKLWLVVRQRLPPLT